MVRRSSAGINHVNEEPKPTGSVASGRAGEERTETVCSRGQAARVVRVRQRAQLADSQIVSVRKKMLEICHCIKGFPLKAAAARAGPITGGRKGNQLTKFSSTKWEDRGTCASSLRLAPRWRETKINLVLLPGYYRLGISQRAFSKASIDVLVPYSTGTVIVAATSILYGERRIYM